MAELRQSCGIDADFRRVHNPCDALTSSYFLLLSLLRVIQAEATTEAQIVMNWGRRKPTTTTQMNCVIFKRIYMGDDEP
ncbi:hypothetical protein HanRHA438_Chr05g0228941 [Helianthus annuus]|nr:hypothetical protein HanXRQr2_Chr05g0219981 [Helianthus annuus]KAJ0570607.1 hypothetical protein HanHA300_Chr05g0179981 [Helianthus annuus]KAJ0577488.1 hypothetical protein HanIR_Chr05g0236571 [Helianthus annuus]KAJ0584951.1 hypothetical protein HanHA89_Chr05g0194691 [Helianthus annuus]KAJ0750615.1 hypothetical protein HanLR1_Chr05g0184031 [Helianthus annuus]